MKKAKVEKTKRKKKFSLWRMLSYVGCFVFVTFAVAFVVVSANSSTYSFTPPSLDLDSSPVENSVLGNMVSNVMAMEDMTAALAVSIQNGDTNISISGDIDLKIYEEFSGVDARADLEINYNGNLINVTIVYNEKLFVQIENKIFELDINDGLSGIFAILNLCGVNVDVDLNSTLSGLDMSALESLGEYITEQTLDDGYMLKFEYGDIAASVVLDAEYNIVSLDVPTISIDGWQIGLGMEVEGSNQDIVVQKPNGDTNFNNIINFAQNAINTISDKNILINADINYDKYNAEFQTIVDGKNVRLNTCVAGHDISLCLVDNTFYGDFDVIKLRGGKADFQTAVDVICDVFDINFDNMFDYDINVSDILGVLKSAISQNWQIVGDENSMTVTYGDAFVEFEYDANKICKVNFDVLGVSGAIDIAHCDEKIVVPDGRFSNISDVAGLIKPIYNMVASKQIGVDLDIVANSKLYSCQIVFDVDNNRLHASTNLYNKDIVFDYADSMLYLQVDGVAVKTHVSDIFGLVMYVVDAYNIDIDRDTLESLLQNQFTIDANGDSYTLAFGEYSVELGVVDDKITNVAFAYDGVEVDAKIALDASIVVAPIVEQNYTQIDVSLENLRYISGLIKEYIEGGKYNLDFGASYGEYGITGYVGYNNGDLQADVEISALGYEVRFVLKNKVGYVYIDDVAVKCDYNVALGIINHVCDALDINVDINKYIDKIKQYDNVDFEQILNDISVSYKNGAFVICYDNIVGKVVFKPNKIQSLSLIIDDLSFDITPTYQKVVVPQNTKHIDVSDVVGVLKSVQDIVQNKYITLDTTIDIEGVEVSVHIEFDYEAMRASAEVEALGKTIYVEYNDNKIYVRFDDVQLYTTVGDIKSLINGYVHTPEIDDNDENLVDKILTHLSKVSLTKTTSGYVVAYDTYTVVLGTTDDKLTSVEYDGILFDISYNKPNFENIDQSKYEYVNVKYQNITNIVEQIKSYINASEYYFAINATYEGYSVSGWIGLDSGHVVGHLESVVIGKNIYIDITNDIVYIEFDGLKLQVGLDDYDDIAKLLKDEWDIKVPQLNLVTPLDMLDEFETPTLDDIQNILSKLSISNSGKMLLVEYEGVRANVDLTDYKLNTLSLNYDKLSATLSPITKRTTAPEGEYIDIASLIDVIKATKKSMANMTMSGVLKVCVVYANEENNIDISYGITYQNKQLKAYANFTFKGLDVNICYVDDTIYCDVVGMKFYVEVKDYKNIIEWLDSTFGLNINVEDIDNVLNKSLDDIHFDFIKSWSIGKNLISANLFDDIHIDVYYGDIIEKVVFNAGSKEATIVCTSFDTLVFETVNKNDYSKYTLLTNTVDDILHTLKKKSFNLSAKARVYEDDTMTYTATVGLVFDFAKHFKAYGEANVVDLLDANGSENFIASWDKYSAVDTRDYVFVNYNGMKLRINEEALKEVLSLALQLFGVDPSIVGFLENVDEDFKVDASNLNTIMPNVDTNNPLNMLKYIKSLDLKNGMFTLKLDGSLFGEGVSDMDVLLHTNNGTIIGLDLNNIFVGGTETFNLSIELNAFDAVPEIEDKTNYLDLSGASQLLKATINTSAKKNFHISGAVKLNLLGMDGMAVVGVDVGVCIGDDGKTTFEATISNYPLIGLVNNVNTNGVGATGKLFISARYRTIKIMYKDGYIYLKTVDEEWGLYKELTRETKIPASYLLQNINYYMQWVLGFTDTIQNSINEAIEASQNYTGGTDYSNILLDYKYYNNSHSITLNLEEIAHNDQVNTMIVGLTTINNAQTGRKDMLYRLDMDVTMLNDVISIKTDDDSYLRLVEYSYDMSETLAYIDNYAWSTFGEYEKEGSGSFEKTNDSDVTINFYDQNETLISTYTGKIGSEIVYPSVTQTLEDGKQFKGWYYYSNSAKTKLKAWKYDYAPLNSMDLYAVWENTYQVVLKDGDEVYKTYTLFKGQTVKLSDMADRFDEVDGVRSGQQFDGWYDGIIKRDEISVKDRDITLKARWAEATYYNITYVDGDTTTNTWVKKDSTVETSVKANYFGERDGEQVVYEWAGWYIDDEKIDSFVVDGPVTLNAKWNICGMDMARTLTIMDGDELLVTSPQLVDYAIILPTHEKLNVDTWYYLDKDLTQRYYVDVMPSDNLTLYVSNQYMFSYKYYESITNGVVKSTTINMQIRQGEDLTTLYVSPERLATGTNADGQIINVYDDGSIKRVTYTFTNYIDKCDVMPNSDLYVEEVWTKYEQLYYDIVFNTDYNYNPKTVLSFTATEYKSGPSYTPEKMRVLEGTTIDLSSYAPTCTMKGTTSSTYNYKCSGWSTTIMEDGSNGGGETSYTVSGNDAKNGTITLYVCWKKQ